MTFIFNLCEVYQSARCHHRSPLADNYPLQLFRLCQRCISIFGLCISMNLRFVDTSYCFALVLSNRNGENIIAIAHQSRQLSQHNKHGLFRSACSHCKHSNSREEKKPLKLAKYETSLFSARLTRFSSSSGRRSIWTGKCGMVQFLAFSRLTLSLFPWPLLATNTQHSGQAQKLDVK